MTSTVVPLAVAVLALPLAAASGSIPADYGHRAVERAAASTPDGSGAAGSVLAISVDGLNPRAIKKLGRRGAPHLHQLIDQGASTLNARTQVEMTVTLPNHTGMVTGRRINALAGGHGVTWNDDRRHPPTVQRAAGDPVDSVFSVVAEAGGSTALFASKSKFSLWKRSWREDIDRAVIDERNPRLVRSLISDLRSTERDFRFLHLSAPDVAGHRHGFMGDSYLAAVARVDHWLGQVLDALEEPTAAGAPLAATTSVLLTADHGGAGSHAHGLRHQYANYRVPFLVSGPGIAVGTDLYELNEAYQDPARRQPGYRAARQPVRNGMVANLALDLLGLPSVPGSQFNAPQDLVVTAATP